MSNPAENLAVWIIAHYPYSDGLTHLKLQKLTFYAYGISLAFDLAQELGDEISFEAWKHGPVCRDIYQKYRRFGAEAIVSGGEECPTYSQDLERLLCAVLCIYGRMDPWEIRNQSHLEQPWKIAFERPSTTIAADDLRRHFYQKFRKGRIHPPEYLFDYGSFGLDNIPLLSYTTIFELAHSLHEKLS